MSCRGRACPARNFAVAAHLAVPLRGVEDAATNGNGRMARNTLEKAILNQSKRLVADPDASLELLLPGDFELE